jgi:hypothetical protein
MLIGKNRDSVNNLHPVHVSLRLNGLSLPVRLLPSMAAARPALYTP